MWQSVWRQRWAEFGPKDLICDADLDSVAKNAGLIHTVEDLRDFTQLFYWEELSSSLFAALTEIVQSLDETPDDSKAPSSNVHSEDSAPKATSRGRSTKTKVAKLSTGETVITFP